MPVPHIGQAIVMDVCAQVCHSDGVEGARSGFIVSTRRTWSVSPDPVQVRGYPSFLPLAAAGGRKLA